MPRFAANLSMLYPELPFLDRFEAAAHVGFEAVEYLFPYAWPAEELAARLKQNGLQQVLMNAPPGGTDGPGIDSAWTAGDATTTPTNNPTVIITENESVGVLNETVVSAPAVLVRATSVTGLVRAS